MFVLSVRLFENVIEEVYKEEVIVHDLVYIILFLTADMLCCIAILSWPVLVVQADRINKEAHGSLLKIIKIT